MGSSSSRTARDRRSSHYAGGAASTRQTSTRGSSSRRRGPRVKPEQRQSSNLPFAEIVTFNPIFSHKECVLRQLNWWLLDGKIKTATVFRLNKGGPAGPTGECGSVGQWNYCTVSQRHQSPAPYRDVAPAASGFDYQGALSQAIYVAINIAYEQPFEDANVRTAMLYMVERLAHQGLAIRTDIDLFSIYAHMKSISATGEAAPPEEVVGTNVINILGMATSPAPVLWVNRMALAERIKVELHADILEVQLYYLELQKLSAKNLRTRLERDKEQDYLLLMLERTKTIPEPERPRAPPPSPASATKPSLPSVVSVTAPAPPVATPTTPVPIPDAPDAPLAPKTLNPVDLRGYNYPGFPNDRDTFLCLYCAHNFYDETGKSLKPSPVSENPMPPGYAYDLYVCMEKLGGWDELERHPYNWKEVALGMGLIEESDNDDQREQVAKMIRQAVHDWLLPFGGYCIQWPKLTQVDRELVIYQLGRCIRNATPNAPLPFDYGIWPPTSLDPISPESKACVYVRLRERSEAGIPTDYATCFYMLKLWDMSKERPMVAPPLPHGINEKNPEMACFSFSVAISKLTGGSTNLLRSPNATWARLAFGMSLIERVDQDDARAKQVMAQLMAYAKNYLCHFRNFCNGWPRLGKKEKSTAITKLIVKLSGTTIPSSTLAPSKGKAPETAQKTPASLGSCIIDLQAADRLWLLEPDIKRSVDLYAYATPGVPQQATIYNFFWVMWFSEDNPPRLLGWGKKQVTVDMRLLRNLIDCFGGRTVLQRYPELWRGITFHMKLVTQEERETELVDKVTGSLRFMENMWLTPFEKFCTNWATLTFEKKNERIGRLVTYLKKEIPDHPLPLPRHKDELDTLQVDVLYAARSMEGVLRQVYPNESFEERIKRLSTMSIRKAKRYGLQDYVLFFQRIPLSDEAVKKMADVLAGQPSSSKPLDVLTTKLLASSWDGVLMNVPTKSEEADEQSVWPAELFETANEFIRAALKKINDSSE
ncbi:hypothetical protein FRC07_008139 [Ceratobasidium sp. 392]|nr:hypothetical protein FRC07_008139 [Ceratobasidium sp. 392]